MDSHVKSGTLRESECERLKVSSDGDLRDLFVPVLGYIAESQKV